METKNVIAKLTSNNNNGKSEIMQMFRFLIQHACDRFLKYGSSGKKIFICKTSNRCILLQQKKVFELFYCQCHNGKIVCRDRFHSQFAVFSVNILFIMHHEDVLHVSIQQFGFICKRNEKYK